MSAPSVSRPPLFDDLDSLVGSPGAASKHVDLAVIQQVSESQNFPNRDARRAKPAAAEETEPIRRPMPLQRTEVAAEVDRGEISSPAPRPHTHAHQPRRFRTGRNIPVNIKLDEATRTLLYELADVLGAPLGSVVEQALLALKEQNAAKQKRPRNAT